jgi:hypothetical protein
LTGWDIRLNDIPSHERLYYQYLYIPREKTCAPKASD